jgi:cytochrome c-type biogenesis protein CcmH/NrfG
MAVLCGLVALLVLTASSCRSGGNGGTPPSSTPPQNYPQIVSTFYTGLMALEVGGTLAQDNLLKVTQLAQKEPAGWADLGLYRIKNDPSGAQQALDQAHTLAPNNARIEAMLGVLAGLQGQGDQAVAHLRHATDLDPSDLRIRYELVKALEPLSTPDADTESQRQLQKILESQPGNLEALVSLAQVAVKTNNAALLRQTVAQLKPLSATWPADARKYLASLEKSAAGSDVRQAITSVLPMRNILVRFPTYQESRDALIAVGGLPAEPVETFLTLPVPSPTPAPPDTALTFTAQPITGLNATKGTVLRELTLQPEMTDEVAQGFHTAQGAMMTARKEGPIWTLLADGHSVHLVSAEGKTVSMPFPGGPSATPPTPDGVLALDFNYDFLPDLALAGAGGVRLYQQGPNSTFTDVTAKTGLPASVTNTAYVGAWAADIEADGDLDIVLAPVQGPPVVLRNNGDGTWTPIRPFSDVSNVRAFVWADLDNDGDDDAAMLDAQGRLFAFENRRSTQFRAWPLPKDLGKVTALTVADVNRDGLFDLMALKADGTIMRLSRNAAGDGWDTAEIVKWPEGANDPTARLFWADLDNNGGLDLIVSGKSGTKAWLADTSGGFQPLAASVMGRVLSIAETNAAGRLDLLGLAASGQPTRFVNKGTQNYHWQVLKPRATFVNVSRGEEALGDSRINSFGVGGSMEVRSGMLYQKTLITGPSLHFGLGQNQTVDAARAIYPNGTASAEFGLPADKMIVARQRLDSSCPWLFAYNGKGMEFVTDCIWRSPLGLKINAQDTAGVTETTDWVKIRGNQLVPHDGVYDLRITAELWETHFFDYLALMTVDHPVGTEIYVDERFVFPQPPLAVIATAPVQPMARAVDDEGHDVSDILKAQDGRYLANFGVGQYQGVTRDHYVEVELPPSAPKTSPLYLVATGWVHPTDSSINVAISQGHHPAPQGLSLEVPDGTGGWKVAKPGLGFPEGKIKTVVLDITGIFQPGTPRRMRLRTNLEIYWDSIGWAAGRPQTPLKTQRLTASRADLRYRGFSETTQADPSVPEVPLYDHLNGTTQRWYDLEGYYTRYGDVRPLLAKTDDRYVIMNAGDELALQYPTVPPPPAGWTRDYVLIGDGWVKDGNLNTTFSKTVLPLPYHRLTTYTTPPGLLEDDPAYRLHPNDWQVYHTRYVTPHTFITALRP